MYDRGFTSGIHYLDDFLILRPPGSDECANNLSGAGYVSDFGGSGCPSQADEPNYQTNILRDRDRYNSGPASPPRGQVDSAARYVDTVV